MLYKIWLSNQSICNPLNREFPIIHPSVLKNCYLTSNTVNEDKTNKAFYSLSHRNVLAWNKIFCRIFGRIPESRVIIPDLDYSYLFYSTFGRFKKVSIDLNPFFRASSSQRKVKQITV